METILKQIMETVRECGRYIKTVDRSAIAVDSKEGPGNFVTEHDSKVQQMLETSLTKIVPDADFMGEEDGRNQKDSQKGKFFVVDPIDGTMNFIKDYKSSCISVALVEDGQVLLGVIYNPYLDEMFWALRGKGAFCNGTQIHVSKEPLSNGLVLFGTCPYYEELYERTFRMAYDYFVKALDLRRSGSAALDLCCIAAGRAELFFELVLQPWDYAAASLIIEEAGGIITTVEGEPLSFVKPCSVLARNRD